MYEEGEVMLARERQNTIVEIVNREGSVRVKKFK